MPFCILTDNNTDFIHYGYSQRQVVLTTHQSASRRPTLIQDLVITQSPYNHYIRLKIKTDYLREVLPSSDHKYLSETPEFYSTLYQTSLRSRTIDNKVVYTKYPWSYFKKFESILDATDKLPNSFLKTAKSYLHNNFHIDRYGDFSFLETSDYNKLKRNNKGEVFSAIVLEHLFKNNKPIRVRHELLTLADMKKKTCFFPVLSQVLINGQVKTIFTLATFINQDIIQKYAKSSMFFYDFFNTLDCNTAMNLEQYFDNSEYIEHTVHAEKYYNYWMPTSFPHLKDMAVTPSSDVKKIQEGKFLTQNELEYIYLADTIKNLPERKQLDQCSKTIDKLKKSITIYDNNISTYETNIVNHNSQIDSYEKEKKYLLVKIQNYDQGIQDLKRDAQIYQVKKEKNLQDKQLVLDSISDTTEVYDDYSVKLQAAVSNISKESLKSYFDNFVNMNVVILDVTLRNASSGTYIKMSENPTAFYDSQNTIVSLKFCNIKPFVIKVIDRSREVIDQIVAGPLSYEITVNDYNDAILYVSALDKNSVIGIRKEPGGYLHWKAHPHLPESTLYDDHINVNHLLEQRKACPGELAASLIRGMQGKQIPYLIYATLAWSTSAYSYDDWGAYYKYFPRYNKEVWNSNICNVFDEIFYAAHATKNGVYHEVSIQEGSNQFLVSEYIDHKPASSKYVDFTNDTKLEVFTCLKNAIEESGFTSKHSILTQPIASPN